MPTFQRAAGLGLAWGTLWVIVGMAVATTIGIADPDSIDPGDMSGLAMIAGSMGVLSGVVFALLSARADSVPAAWSIPRVALWGTLATAIVQVAYLGHGDAGLVANIQMALVFCAVGGVIAVAWLVLARGWSDWAHRFS